MKKSLFFTAVCSFIKDLLASASPLERFTATKAASNLKGADRLAAAEEFAAADRLEAIDLAAGLLGEKGDERFCVGPCLNC